MLHANSVDIMSVHDSSWEHTSQFNLPGGHNPSSARHCYDTLCSHAVMYVCYNHTICFLLGNYFFDSPSSVMINICYDWELQHEARFLFIALCLYRFPSGHCHIKLSSQVCIVCYYEVPIPLHDLHQTVFLRRRIVPCRLGLGLLMIWGHSARTCSNRLQVNWLWSKI